MTASAVPRVTRPVQALARAGLVALLVAAALGARTARAQDARSLGMGGVTLPGPGAAVDNPAFAALPGTAGTTSLALPMGALSALTADYWDPYSPGFDALSTLDQASNLGQYLLNPAISPADVVLTVDGSGLSVAFSGGSPLRLTDPASFDAGFDLPLGGSVGPLKFGVRPFTSIHARFTPGPDLKAVFGSGSASASGTLTAVAEAGVALDFGAAVPIPLPADVLGGGHLYAGVRVSAIAGLARAEASFQGQAQAQTDTSGNYTGTVTYNYDGTISLGGVMYGNVGYGGLGAAGVAASIPTGVGTVTAGLAVRHAGVMVWNLRQTRYQGDQTGSTTTNLGTVRAIEIAKHVQIGANLALDVGRGRLGLPGMDLLLAADGDLDVSGGWAAHAGAEASFGPLAVRAGVGYQDGLRLGVGAGVRAAGVGLDVALSSHRSPFTDHQAYGVSASLGFGL